MFKNTKKPIVLSATGNKKKIVVFLLIFILIALAINIVKPLRELLAKWFGNKDQDTKPLADKISEAATGAVYLGVGVLLLTMAAPLAATPVGWALIAIGLTLTIVGGIMASDAFNIDLPQLNKKEKKEEIDPNINQGLDDSLNDPDNQVNMNY